MSATLFLSSLIFCTGVLLAIGDESTVRLTAKMPSVRPTRADTYLCSAHKLPNGQHFIVGYEPHASQETAHHLLLYGCSTPGDEKSDSWECGVMGNTCGWGGTSEIVFAWAKNAPGLTLPKDVGFSVGGSSGVNYVVLQIHYKHAFRKGVTDSSGVTLLLTPTPQPYLASIYLFMTYGKEIEGGTERTDVDMACPYLGSPMHPFAFRVHAHDLGKRIMAYRIRNGNWTKIAMGSPQNPQAFYPIKDGPTIVSGDVLATRCVFDSTERHESTGFGATAKDEMCNFYMMFYSSAKNKEGQNSEVSYKECLLDGYSTWESFPYEGQALDYDDIRIGQPTERDVQASATEAKVAWESADREHDEVSDLLDDSAALSDATESAVVSDSSLSSVHLEMQRWPTDGDSGHVKFSDGERLGQVGGVSVSTSGLVYVFHRASRIWDVSSFDFENNFLQRDDGPIAEATVAVLDPSDGNVLKTWGSKTFYLPHGITVDSDDNVWLTDVAMHQVFKYKPDDNDGPSLTLGEEFVVGSDANHFCKPADVAVLEDGRFFVADGYCNSRIVRFKADGSYDTEWGAAGTGNALPSVGLKGSQSFVVVHALTVSKDLGILCAADRENGRVLCYEYETGNFMAQFGDDEFGGRAFSVSFSSSSSNVFVINGAGGEMVQGFTLDHQYRVVDTWNSDPALARPHTLAVARDGSVYVGEIGPNRVWKFQSSTSSSISGTARATIASSSRVEASTASETTVARATSRIDGTGSTSTSAVVTSSTTSAPLKKLAVSPSAANEPAHSDSTSATNSSHEKSPSPTDQPANLEKSSPSNSSLDANKFSTIKNDSGFHPSLLPVVLICSLVTVPVLLILIVGIACRKKSVSRLAKHKYQPIHSQETLFE